MTDILSQDEIDALLSAISSGDLAETEAPAAVIEEEKAVPAVTVTKAVTKKKIKVYDFKRPDRFSKDQIRTLQMMHESFARMATTALSGRLRALTHVHVQSVDQMTYEEFIKSIPHITTIAIIDMAPLKGKAVFEIDPGITYAIIDRLFGGEGKTPNLERELTDVEASVMEKVIIRLLNDLKEAWAGVIFLRPKLDALESNPQFVQVVPPTDMVVLVTFSTKIGDIEGMTNLCIPYITIESIVSKLSAQLWYASIRKGGSSESMQALRKRISNIYVPIVAELGATKVSFDQILSLQTGDVIKLDNKHKEDITVKVGLQTKFKCRPGVSGSKKAIQITGIADVTLSDELSQSVTKGGELANE
ncbi:MAG: flagellar motor switch protein FliM [Candidatus Hydrogenedentota bacterium]